MAVEYDDTGENSDAAENRYNKIPVAMQRGRVKNRGDALSHNRHALKDRGKQGTRRKRNTDGGQPDNIFYG